MPTDVESLATTLEQASSVLDLPEDLREDVLRILEKIHRGKVKRNLLTTKELREEVGMSPNRFCLFFRWLQKEHCTVRRTVFTRTTKDGRAEKIRRKYVDISKVGETALLNRHTLLALTEVMRNLRFARSLRKQIALVVDLVVEALDLVYRESYFSGNINSYEEVIGGLEERLRERLDEEIGDQKDLAYDSYLVVKRNRRSKLLQDAREAMKRGHFLTANHRYVLHKWDHVSKNGLVDHNTRWGCRIMDTYLSGTESPEEFHDLVDPWRIVERETEERGICRLQAPVFTRDRYHTDGRWEPNIKNLQRRWEQARSKHLGVITLREGQEKGSGKTAL